MMARKLKKYRPSASQKKCQCNTTKVVFKKNGPRYFGKIDKNVQQ